MFTIDNKISSECGAENYVANLIAIQDEFRHFYNYIKINYNNDRIGLFIKTSTQ